MIAVIDTNILVSGLWKPAGSASLLVAQLLSGAVTPCYDYRIIDEYRDVLNRPKFRFSPALVDMLLDTVIKDGIAVAARPLPDADVRDEDDRAFFEVAKAVNAPLVTGNMKHFPPDPLVISLADFCQRYL